MCRLRTVEQDSQNGEQQSRDGKKESQDGEKESRGGEQDIQDGDHSEDYIVVQVSVLGLPGPCRRSTDRTDDNCPDAMLLANSGGGSIPRESVIMGVPARICRTT